MGKLEQFQEIECACTVCQSMCYRPCWGTPEDMQKIIDAGYGNFLAVDWWETSIDAEPIEVLCPSLKGYESRLFPFFPISKHGCTFFNENNKCDLHDKGLKPIAGKLAHHTRNEGFAEEIAELWKTDQAKKLIDDWKEKYMLDPCKD